MPSKVTFLAGFGAGYVLGARAGRGRYEQIARAARGFARNPMVQSTASTLQHQAADALGTAKDRAASSLGPTLQEKRPHWLGGGRSADMLSAEVPVSTTNGHGHQG